MLHAASMESYPSLFHVVSRHDFDECYHLAAQSFVAESFADGFSTMSTNIRWHPLTCWRRSGSCSAEMPVLFCRIERDVRQSARVAANRSTPFHPA